MGELYSAAALATIVVCCLCNVSPLALFGHDFLSQATSRFNEVVGQTDPWPWKVAKVIGRTYPWPWTLLRTPDANAIWLALTYYSPWLLLASMVLSGRVRFLRELSADEKKLLVVALACAQYMQMFPNSDLSHYVRATMVYAVMFSYGAETIWRHTVCGRVVWRSAMCGLLLVSLFGLHTGPILRHQALSLRRVIVQGYPPPSALPHSRYLKVSWEEAELLAVTQALLRYPHDKLFVAGNCIVYYLLSGKQPVVAYYNTTPVRIHSTAQQEEIVQALRENDVGVILKCPPLPNRPKQDTRGLSILWAFITKNYSVKESLYGYDIMVKAQNTPD